MLKQCSNDLKAYHFLDKIKIDYYVDAKDQRQWKIGKIKSIKTLGIRTYVTIRFDGHTNQWNQEFELPATNKLAPFRKYSFPYTGPTTDIVRDIPSLNLEIHRKNLQRNQIVDQIKPQIINQYYRGQLFILVDHIMTRKNSCQMDEYPTILQFLKAYIVMGVKFIEAAHSNAQQILSEGINEYNLIYVNSKMSAFYACIEFLYNFNSLVYKQERRVKFFLINQKNSSSSQAYKIFKDFFISVNILGLCDRIMSFRSKSGRGYPWAIKKDAFILTCRLDQNVQFPQIKDNKQALDSLQYLCYLYNKDAISRQIYQQKQVQLVIFLIISGSFERKLKGLNELRSIVERGFKSKLEIVLNQLKKKKLIQVLIDNNTFNSELFKRSIPIFEFANKYKILTNNHLIQILSLHKDKHQLELKAFYATLSQFGKFLDQGSIELFFQQLIQLPFQENMIALIRQFTFAVVNNHQSYRKAFMSNDGKGFGVTYFWDLIQSGNVVNQHLRGKTIQSLAALLVNAYYNKQIGNFIFKSIKSIQQKKNIDSHLKIIHQAMKICKGQKMKNVIESIERDIPVVDSVLRAVTEDNTISQNALENMFQFLQQVNHVAKKGININHIKIFWQMKNCRKSLLKFLRNYRSITSQDKSQQKIINKQLDSQTIKAIFENIFLRQDLMEGYKQISSELYQTIDQLLICYNHSKGYIDYNYKHTIRVKKIQNLFGIQIYSSIIINIDDRVMAQKCIRRLIEFYLRPTGMSKSLMGGSDVAVKVNAWNTVLHKLSLLDRYIFLAYSILLEQIQGRMKSLNILQSTPMSINVSIRSLGKSKTIILPRCTSLWKLRLVINQQFKLENTNFQIIYAENSSRTNFQKEQDFSIAAIPLSKQDTLNIVISTSKQIHPHFVAIEAFKESFIDTRGQTLYQMLATQNYEEQKTILSILAGLPFIKSIQKKILKLDSTDWNNILDSESKGKLVYQLKIINNIKNLKWVTGFIQKKGLEHISKILLNKNTIQDYKILSSLMNLFCQILKFYKTTNNSLPFGDNFISEILKLPKLPTQDFQGYLTSCFSVINQLTNYQINAGILFKHHQISRILQISLFNTYLPNLPLTIMDIAIKSNNIPILVQRLIPFLKWNFLENKFDCCRAFFDLIVLIIQKKDNQVLLGKVVELLKFIRFENIYEISYQRVNWILQGFLRIVKILMKKYAITDLFKQQESSFLNFLLKQCLFNEENSKNIKFKSLQTRKLAFELLKQTKQKKLPISSISQIIVPMMQKGVWRKQYQWNIKPIEIGKKKYTGLRNLAATCYINSLLQQLYFIKDFSQGLLALDTQLIQDKQNIAYQIQKIFAFLKYSDNLFYTTQSLCRTFILDGQPINPRVQTDVDQFFHSLMDKLQRNLKPINQHGLIDNTFRGQYSNLIVGQECPHTSQRVQHFLSMRLQIKQKKSLEMALQQFIKGEILEGQNAYSCQRCDKKVKVLKRICVKSLPNILILTLKRFQFNFETMEKQKLNTFCSFPQQLNMLPYMRQTLSQQDPLHLPEYYQYRLKGVIIHYGISEAGHYTSYVRTSQNSWSYFDDQRCQIFEVKNLEEQCFGGTQSNPYGDDEEKKKNAYLLFYEKINIPNKQQQIVHQNIKKQVEDDNLKNQQIRLLFDQGLQTFIINNADLSQKLLFIYFHLVVLRTNKKKIVSQFYHKCQQLLKINIQLGKWYLQQINYNFLNQFVIFGDKDARYLVTSLILIALNKNIDLSFMKRCLKCIGRKNMNPFVKILKHACKTHPEYRKYLGQMNLAERVLKLIADPNYNIIIKDVQDNRSQFGYSVGDFIQRKDNSDGSSLLEGIQTLKANISLEQIQYFMYKARNEDTQNSLAKIVANRYKDIENFTNLYNNYLVPRLLKFQPKLGEEFFYNFFIELVRQLAIFQDDLMKKRHQALIDLYIGAIKEALPGYKAMRMLLEGLFKICFSNLNFRDKFSNVFNDKQIKKLIKPIRQWIKDCQSLSYMLKAQKWGYWKKVKYTSTTMSYHQIENQQKLPVDLYLSYLNSLIEKHNLTFKEDNKPKIDGDVIVEEFTGKVKYKVKDRLGLLLEVIGDDQSTKFIPQNEAIAIQ